MISTSQNSMSVKAQNNAGKVHSHLSFTANLSPTKPKSSGSERITVHWLRLKNPNLRVKKLGSFRLDSFYGHQRIANFWTFFIAFPYDYQSYGSLRVGHWKRKLVFLSVQVIFYNPHGVVGVGWNNICTGTRGPGKCPSAWLFSLKPLSCPPVL